MSARDWSNLIAMTLGYSTLALIGVLLTGYVYTLVHDAISPPQKPQRITVDRYGPFLSPHPHRTPVYHVEHAPDEASAWRAILEKSA